MIYLLEFKIPTTEKEERFCDNIKQTCYDTIYPFGTLLNNGLKQFNFEPITILYGENGSGKSTVLNLISEKLGLHRDTLYNRSNFYEEYLELCDYDIKVPIPIESRIITSDDVFDFMLNIRSINNGVDIKREELFADYISTKNSQFQMKSLDDYEQLKKINYVRSNSQSKYVRSKLVKNIREHSNGESAFLYFADKIKEKALYLLDEPENSLSPRKQLELTKFIEESARFFECQFIIATHSPFLLSLKHAKIYDFDETPVAVKAWSELESIRIYYDFFMQNKCDFED